MYNLRHFRLTVDGEGTYVLIATPENIESCDFANSNAPYMQEIF
jgi:hypothetical protein